jgi:MATE family multidrug resistance protein
MLDDREAPYAGLKEILTMAGPIVLASISITTMGVVDTAMVGHLGKNELAGVGSASLWAFTLATFFIGTVGCVGTFVSQCVGKGDLPSCARYAWQGIHLSLATCVIAAIAYPFASSLFGAMPHDPGVRQVEVEYFEVRMAGFFLMPLQAALAAFFNAISRPMVSMFASISANILNAILAYCLIFGAFGFPEMRCAGAAWATNVALLMQCVFLMVVFLGPGMHETYGTRRAMSIEWVKLRELLRIGWGGGLAFLLDLFTWSIFTSVIVGGVSASALAAHNVAVQVMSVSFMPAVGVNNAIAPIVGQWIGRGNIARAKSRTYTAMRITMVYMFLMGVVFASFGGPIIAYGFNDDPEVIRLGKTILILAAIFQTFDAINIVIMGALRGAGDTRWTAIMMTSFALSVFLPLAYVLSRYADMGAPGAWIGATVYVIGLSLFFFMRWHGEKWRHIQIFDAGRGVGGVDDVDSVDVVDEVEKPRVV